MKKCLLFILAALLATTITYADEFNFFNITNICQDKYQIKVVAPINYTIKGCIEEREDVWTCSCDIKKAIIDTEYNHQFFFTIQDYISYAKVYDNTRIYQYALYTGEKKDNFVFPDISRYVWIIIAVLIMLVCLSLLIFNMIKNVYNKEDDEKINDIVYQSEMESNPPQDMEDNSFKDNFDSIMKNRAKYMPDRINEVNDENNSDETKRFI